MIEQLELEQGNDRRRPNELLWFSAVLVAALVLVQSVYIFVLPVRFVALFHNARPLVYIAVAAVFWIYAGRDVRPCPKGGQASVWGAVGAIAYFGVLLGIGVLFGFGSNVMAPSVTIIVRHAWVYAVPVLMGEALRYRIIREMPRAYKRQAIVALTPALAFAEFDVLRGAAFNSIWRNTDIFYNTILPALILGVLLGYMALEGSLWSLFFIAAAYSLPPVMMPTLPRMSMVVWGLVASVCLLFTLLFYYRRMKYGTLREKRAAKRRAKYAKKHPEAYLIPTAVFVTLLVVFALRMMPWFPVAILTGSMDSDDGFPAGALVFITKIAPEDVYDTVEFGQIILFRL
ncbi:MAG: hypothetical protein FWE59_07115, partial [Oscillospiraceae bacterium]|nr:hypothetical protein [Oscillospiraceae bacterium]